MLCGHAQLHLVAHRVREVTWSGPRRDAPLTVWAVGSSVPRIEDGSFSLTLAMWSYPGVLSLTAESAAFFVGEVPGLAEAPPDYTGRDRTTIIGEIAGWQSAFEPVQAVFHEAHCEPDNL